MNVSVLTIKKAYAELYNEGFIITRSGKGTFVASMNFELIKKSKSRIVEIELEEVWKNACLLGICKNEVLDIMNLIFEKSSKKLT